jgi:biopolymer transport protein ExbB/TolQ
MIKYFYEGGPLFMSLVTILGLVAIGFIINVIIGIIKGKKPSSGQLKNIPIAGSAAFMMGILAQAIGLYQAMTAIQAAGDISPAIVAGGFQVSLIAPIYGLILFIFTLITYIIIRLFSSSSNEIES